MVSFDATTSAPGWLREELVTLAWCWRLARRDGVAIGLTSHDRDLIVGGMPYRAAPGMKPSAIETRDAIDAATMDLEGAIASDAIAADDLDAGRWDGAAVELFVTDWSAPDAAPASAVQPGALKPGDRLRITVVGEEELSGVFQVGEDRMVHLELVGAVPAGGLTLAAFEDILRDRLAAGYLKNPQILVARVAAPPVGLRIGKRKTALRALRYKPPSRRLADDTCPGHRACGSVDAVQRVHHDVARLATPAGTAPARHGRIHAQCERKAVACVVFRRQSPGIRIAGAAC